MLLKMVLKDAAEKELIKSNYMGYIKEPKAKKYVETKYKALSDDEIRAILAAVDDKLIGQKISMPVYMPNGLILLNEGATISGNGIKKMKDMGINTVYIKDENDNIVIEEVLPTQIRLSINRQLEEVFNDVSKKRYLNCGAVTRIVDDIIDNINISENAFIFNNIGKKEESTNLCEHSLNVAILSIIIGKNKQYDIKKLTNLGIGALLHDIGKLFDKGKDHAKLGYEFVRDTNQFSPTSTICIYEHHENEDGSGYPEGKKGEKIYEFAKIVSICNDYVYQVVDTPPVIKEGDQQK
jgi:putative nucleotidyltransferase with HDIG domain